MKTLNLLGSYYGDLGIFFYLIPTISCFAAAFSLFSLRHRTLAQIYLAVVFIVLGVGMSFSFIYDRYLTENYNEILRSVNFIISVGCSVAVLFYYIALMRPKLLTWKFVSLCCFGWFMYSLSIILMENFSIHFEYVIMTDNSSTMTLRLFTHMCIVVFDLWLIYFILRMYRKHKKFILENYSNAEQVDLHWIGVTMVLFILMAFVDILWMLNSSIEVKMLFNVITFFSVVIIFRLGFRQGEIPLLEMKENEINDFQCELPEQVELILEPKNDKAVKLNTKTNGLQERLTEYFERKKPYLDSDLTLNSLAELMNTNRTYISNTINNDLGTSFHGFVNRYRLEHALHLLEEDEMSIADIVIKSGFKSRSAFYKLFRQEYGCTPSEYISNADDTDYTDLHRFKI